MAQAESRMIFAEDAKKVSKVLAGVAAIAARHDGPIAFGLIAIYGSPGDNQVELLQKIEAVMPPLEALDSPAVESANQEVLPLAK